MNREPTNRKVSEAECPPAATPARPLDAATRLLVERLRIEAVLRQHDFAPVSRDGELVLASDCCITQVRLGLAEAGGGVCVAVRSTLGQVMLFDALMEHLAAAQAELPSHAFTTDDSGLVRIDWAQYFGGAVDVAAVFAAFQEQCQALAGLLPKLQEDCYLRPLRPADAAVEEGRS